MDSVNKFFKQMQKIFFLFKMPFIKNRIDIPNIQLYAIVYKPFTEKDIFPLIFINNTFPFFNFQCEGCFLIFQFSMWNIYEKQTWHTCCDPGSATLTIPAACFCCKYCINPVDIALVWYIMSSWSLPQGKANNIQ